MAPHDRSGIIFLTNSLRDLHYCFTALGLVPKRSHRRKKDGNGRSSERAVSELSFHSLRHTATSLMKNAGISPAIVQEFVVHDSKAVSENYTQ